jgi:2-hydroxy-6-oxonona-2,4-dienedioate hydrolase
LKAVFARLVSTATAAAQRALGARATELPAGDWRLRFYRGGRRGGEPWVLLHGMGATSATWLPLERHLRDQAELWMPELSELGGTVGPRAAMTVPDGVAALERLFDREFGSRRPTLAGISLGGWIATRFAAAHPERVGRLLLVVPGGYRDQDWREIERMVRVSTFADTREMWRALFVAPPWYLRFARYFFFLAYTSRAVSALLDAVREEDAFGDAELARLTMPVGLIWGERDLLFRLEVGRRMAAALGQGRLWSIADAGHAVQWERQREFLAAVEEFRAAYPLSAEAEREQDRDDPDPGGTGWPRPTT